MRLTFLTVCCTSVAATALATAGTIRLEFRPGENGRELVLGKRESTNRREITRLDWLVSGLALQRKDGTWSEGREWFGYLSTSEGRLHVDADGVSAEEYRALRFRVGVDALTDKSDPAQWPPGHALNP